MKNILALFTIAISFQAFAIVDMRNANYSDTWVDIEVPGAGFPLKIQRTYNSRTLFNGMFGFGMCADVETNVEVAADGNLKLTECGAGQETVYMPLSASPKEVDRSVEEIAKVYKAKNPGQNSAAINKLKEQMKNDRQLRDKYAEDYGVRGKPVGNMFFANGRGPDSIELKDGHYLRKLPGGEVEKFDSKGHLVGKTDRNGNSLKFNYQNELLKDITDNNGRRLSFSYHPNKKIKDITGANGLNAEYKFKNQVDLAEVKNGWGNIYKYDYDELHNLTLIQFPDKTNKKLTYDQNKDWVLSFKDRDDCAETYKYESSKDDPQNHYWSIVTKKCGDKVVTSGRYEFWYKTNKSKADYYLARVLMKSNDNTTDITYDSSLGRPLSITRNGKTIKYEYDNTTGLLKSRKEGNRQVKFDYHPSCQKVAKVSEGKTWTDFTYDEKCNLMAAKNSRGQTVGLRYDRQGRIVTMVDQAKREVKIAYEDRFGKPKAVERTGVGTLEVTYKPNGEINKVDSPSGPAVATQVAGAFNNLLEIVEPAGVEFGL